MTVSETITRRAGLIAALLTAMALARMATTFRVFSATTDEAMHVAAGLEIYQFHSYRAQRENPPLPRLVMAAAPYLGGMRFDPTRPWPLQLRDVFQDAQHKYERNLFLARIGNLLFFALAALLIWFAARDGLGAEGALLAVLLFTMEPVVMGYGGLATHDIPATAGFILALVAFRSILRSPTLGRALLFGAAFGISILCKFSNLGYVPAAAVAVTLVRLLRDGVMRKRLAPVIALMLPAALMTLLTIWAGYGLSCGERGELGPFESAFGPRVEALLSHIAPSTRIPAIDFFIGIAGLIRVSRNSLTSYLCLHTSTTGWWWYFPFAVALKTTIAALVLFVSGAFIARGPLLTAWLEWTAATLAVICVAMTSPLDIGVRYVLPAYASLAIAAAACALVLLRASRPLQSIAALLLVLQIGASVLAHPDYFPYFNAFAGHEPGRYLIDSNLDWGQDVLRLRKTVRELKITRLSTSIMSIADYDALGFPPTVTADPWRATHGWIAVSEQSFRLASLNGGWTWLPPEPYRQAGKSIRLYRSP
jgi:Dolichyl-phosphate-mannose-protein mannosyltransferase